MCVEGKKIANTCTSSRQLNSVWQPTQVVGKLSGWGHSVEGGALRVTGFPRVGALLGGLPPGHTITQTLNSPLNELKGTVTLSDEVDVLLSHLIPDGHFIIHHLVNSETL